MTTPARPEAAELADEAGFELLPPHLAEELKAALETAVDGGVAFVAGRSPLAIFRSAVAESVRDIEGHPMGVLLGRFLRDGPYEGQGPIPTELAGQRLSDEEAAQAVRFVYSFMVNTFKGHLAELLAARAVAAIVEDLKSRGQLPAGARIFAGDLVQVGTLSGAGWAKGADLHVLELRDGAVRLCGVAEVKSYTMPRRGLTAQLDQHVERARRGLLVGGVPYGPAEVSIGGSASAAREALRIEVATAGWTLPRQYHLDDEGLHLPTVDPPPREDVVEQTTPGRWRVTLRWSREALAEAALEMTFWYMGKVGQIHYAERPAEWQEMTPADAGRNAVKMMLYYALLRAPEGSLFERQAIALYNAYGFGYAVGMNFIGPGRRRRMLWFEDLREIQEAGKTADGGRIRGLELASSGAAASTSPAGGRDPDRGLRPDRAR